MSCPVVTGEDESVEDVQYLRYPQLRRDADEAWLDSPGVEQLILEQARLRNKLTRDAFFVWKSSNNLQLRLRPAREGSHTDGFAFDNYVRTRPQTRGRPA